MAAYIEKNEDLEDEPYKDNEDVENEEEWTHPDKGVSLVIQHLLYTPKKEDDTQRHSIFKTRCTVNERVNDLIVDGGSSENIILKTMVNKLQLKTHKHLSLYRIG